MTINIESLVDAIAERLHVRRYYTPAEISEILKVDTDGVIALIRSGELVASNVARSKAAAKPRWRISQESLDRFLASRTNAPTTTKRSRKTSTVKDYFA